MKHKERSAQRGGLIWPAELISQAGAIPVRLKNLSRSGARICIGEEIKADTEVVLQTKQIFAAANIAWAKDGEAGLEFYRDHPVAAISDTGEDSVP